MGIVTSFTAQKMQEIQDSSIVNVNVDPNTGHLILQNRGLINSDVGYVVGPVGATGTATPTNAVAATLSPVGGIQAYAGAVIPNGWLECNGQSVAISGTYNALYLALNSGTIYGSTASLFVLPNFRNRIPIGQSTIAGEITTTLGSNNSSAAKDAITATHSHPHVHGTPTNTAGVITGVTNPAFLSKHAVSGHVNTVNGPISSFTGDTNDRTFIAVPSGTKGYLSVRSFPGALATDGAAKLASADPHAVHNHTFTNDAAGISTTSSEINANLAPYIVIKYIIKY